MRNFWIKMKYLYLYWRYFLWCYARDKKFCNKNKVFVIVLRLFFEILRTLFLYSKSYKDELFVFLFWSRVIRNFLIKKKYLYLYWGYFLWCYAPCSCIQNCIKMNYFYFFLGTRDKKFSNKNEVFVPLLKVFFVMLRTIFLYSKFYKDELFVFLFWWRVIRNFLIKRKYLYLYWGYFLWCYAPYSYIQNRIKVNYL